jgi:hypothetical protein
MTQPLNEPINVSVDGPFYPNWSPSMVALRSLLRNLKASLGFIEGVAYLQQCRIAHRDIKDDDDDDVCGTEHWMAPEVGEELKARSDQMGLRILSFLPDRLRQKDERPVIRRSNIDCHNNTTRTEMTGEPGRVLP